MTWIIVIVLIVIAVQLIRSNKLKEHKLELDKQAKEEAETDDLLKHRYPHIFHEMKDGLRSYHHAWQEYNEDFERALKYHIDTRDDLVVSSTHIMQKIQKLINESENKKKLEHKMLEIVKFSRSFFENLSKQRDITDTEKSYISFLVWSRIDEYMILEPEKILELDMEFIKMWHEEYDNFFPTK